MNDLKIQTESVSSVLRRDEEKRQEKEDNKKDNFIDLDSLYKLYINKDAIDKYEDRFAQLSHIDKNANKLRGYMYFMNSTGKKGDLVAFISIKLESGKTWIDTLEVTPDYRGNKISHQLLDVACDEFGATDIRVNKNNERAIRIFKKYGFMEYDRKNQWLYMSNDSSTTSNPVQKHETKSATETAESLAMEAIFGKPSRDKLIEDAMKKITKKIKTDEDKVAFKKNLTENERTFKAALKSLKDLDKKLSKGTIAPKDYDKQRKMAYGIMKKAMIEFNVNINNIIDNANKPTMDEYNSVLPIISEIKSKVNKIKAEQSPAQEGILAGIIAAPFVFAGFGFLVMGIKSKIDDINRKRLLKKHPEIANNIETCLDDCCKEYFKIFEENMKKNAYFNSSEYKKISKESVDNNNSDELSKDCKFAIRESNKYVDVLITPGLRSPTYKFEYKVPKDDENDNYTSENITPVISKIESEYKNVIQKSVSAFNSSKAKTSIESKYNCEVNTKSIGTSTDGDADHYRSNGEDIRTEYYWAYTTLTFMITFNTSNNNKDDANERR